MKSSKKIVCISLLVSTLIVPTTSYASNNQSTKDQNSISTVINQLFSFFQGNTQSVIKGADVNVGNNSKEYFSNTDTFYIGDKKFSSKEIEKYNTNGNNRDNDSDRDRDRDRDRDGDCDSDPDHDHHDHDDDFDSMGIWRDWYCYGDWDWDWWNWGD